MGYAIAAIVVSALVSAYATYSASQAQASAQDYQAKVAKQQQQAARDAAAIAAQNAEARMKRVLGAQRAAIGAAGVLGTEGSPLLVQLQSAEDAALDIARIRYGGEARASGFRAEEILQRWQAGATRRAGYIGAGASLLGGAAKAYGVYSTGKTSPYTTDYTTTNF